MWGATVRKFAVLLAGASVAAVLGACGSEPVAQHTPAPDGKLSIADTLAPGRAKRVLAAGLTKVLTAEASTTHGTVVNTSSGKAVVDEVAGALRAVDAQDVRPTPDGAAVVGTLPASRAIALLGLDSSLAARGIDSATVAGTVPVEILLDREGAPVSIALRGSDVALDSAHVPAAVQDEVGAASYEALVNPSRQPVSPNGGQHPARPAIDPL